VDKGIPKGMERGEDFRHAQKGRGERFPGMSSHVIQSLEQLIRAGNDGAEGYLLAADEVISSDLRTFLVDQSEKRGNLAWDLQDALFALGREHPYNGGSILGVAHRLWMRLRHAAAAQDEDRILEECERGEEMALAEYRVALHQDLPPPVAHLLGEHVEQIREAQAAIRERRAAMASMHAERW
jgi:uncharacterized protein (TIGR02284 family)